eukprot:9487872-Pyramimonas_sp.AAC.1
MAAGWVKLPRTQGACKICPGPRNIRRRDASKSLELTTWRAQRTDLIDDSWKSPRNRGTLLFNHAAMYKRPRA